MRKPRLLRSHAVATYHVVSRIVDRRLVICDAEKQFFYNWMRKLETFCGVRILTHCLMSNHFHLLVRVPCKDLQPALTEEQLRDFLPLLYDGRQLLAASQELDRAVAAGSGGDTTWLAQILARYDARRFDLSLFLKELKQRFSQWYNARNERCGHVWESAFRSVLVEDGEQALLAMAGYIDLNPIRAGLCADPKDYRWSGYGEAEGGRGAGAGRRQARKGLSEMLQATRFGLNRKVNWSNAGPRYRILLYALGVERDADERTGAPRRLGLKPEAVAAELAEVERPGKPSLPEILHSRVRYFSEGQAIGGDDFVEEVFSDNRDRFGHRRTDGARKMAGADWGDLAVLCIPRRSKSGLR